ncbi:hypothetical protein V6N13_092586 [Hibiscus sabdariffa]|uniref:Uncharacterized protein n=2 Tax=Hibiscus sabdariffa TaxID=183260 RepID=A0ABR2CCS4_9ROSI
MSHRAPPVSSTLVEGLGIVASSSCLEKVEIFLVSKLRKNSSTFYQDQLNFHKLFGCNCQNLERRCSLESASSRAVVQKERDIDMHAG